MTDKVEGPLWLGVLDLDLPFVPLPPPSVRSEPFAGVRLVVRLHGRPLGELTVPLHDGTVSVQLLADRVTQRFGDAVREHLEGEGASFDPSRIGLGLDAGGPPAPCSWQSRLELTGLGTPLVSVVLATCRRPERLLRTLRTLTAQTYPALEILVVDNCPSEPGAQQAVDALGDPRVRLLTEPVPGASRARNAGLRAASGDIVAFTDDDVDADPDWVGNVTVGLYEDPQTACVTGLILPLALDTLSQRTFEQFGGFSKGYQPRTFALQDTDRGVLYPYTAGMFGSGACSAFRREVLLELGGFPVDLGPATPARGGEDLYLYLSVLYAGHLLQYDPAAVVRHDYHPTAAQLGQQVYSYGLGISAMITKRVLQSRAERRFVLRALPAAAVYVLAKDSPKNAGKTESYPVGLTLRELAGILCGPVSYLLSRRHARRLAVGRS
ncbi:MAG: glycosyl transferase, family 2 [Frankiales bacterium]|nr:glycosyl transferase, family 2 [Frankiales bacterium]